MTKISTDDIMFSIDDSQLKTLTMDDSVGGRQMLASLWGADVADLPHYQAIFYNSDLSELTENDSFITLSFISHGYVTDTHEPIAINEAKKQIEIDLEIINRESEWSDEESIYFEQWWPQPTMDIADNMLEFGISLKDYYGKVFNRTLNRIFLTRYGHLLLNYSLSESAINSSRSIEYYQEKFDEIQQSMVVSEGYRYQDVDNDNDMQSRSKLINLILSSEIF